MEKRICIVCNSIYLYDGDCGADIGCCSLSCEETLMDELYEEFEEPGVLGAAKD